jgi:hypothetical protein
VRLAPGVEYDLAMVGLMVGFVLAVPTVVWGYRDVRRIPHWVWRTERSKEQPWLTAMLIGTLLGGWPGIVVVLAWRTSHQRVVLLEDWERLERV